MTKLIFTSLAKAVAQLEAGLQKIGDNPDDLQRDGVIQRFEYTMDLSWKFIQRYLKTETFLADSAIRTKKDLFREAARLGLIDDTEKWFGYYEARNITSHTYNQEAAEEILAKVRPFSVDARNLLENLMK